MQFIIQKCLIDLLHTHGRRIKYVQMFRDCENISKLPKHTLKQVRTLHPNFASNPVEYHHIYSNRRVKQWLSQGEKNVILDFQPIQCNPI